MSILDIIVLILVGLAGFSSFKAGFTRSIWGVFALGAGFVVASQVWQELAYIIEKVIPQEDIAKWISIVVLILIVSIIVDLIFGRIHRLFEEGILGWLNSLLGLCLGVASSVIIVALLLHFLYPQISTNFANEFENSLFASYLEEFGEEVWTFGKENVKRHLESE